MSQYCGTIRHGRGTGKHTAARRVRQQGAPYRVRVALVALVGLRSDRQADGMRFSVQIVGRERTVSRLREKGDKR